MGHVVLQAEQWTERKGEAQIMGIRVLFGAESEKWEDHGGRKFGESATQPRRVEEPRVDVEGKEMETRPFLFLGAPALKTNSSRLGAEAAQVLECERCRRRASLGREDACQLALTKEAVATDSLSHKALITGRTTTMSCQKTEVGEGRRGGLYVPVVGSLSSMDPSVSVVIILRKAGLVSA